MLAMVFPEALGSRSHHLCPPRCIFLSRAVPCFAFNCLLSRGHSSGMPGLPVASSKTHSTIAKLPVGSGASSTWTSVVWIELCPSQR